MSSYDKMRSGKVYFCNDEELSTLQRACLERLYDYNNTRPSEFEKREKLLKEQLEQHLVEWTGRSHRHSDAIVQ